MIKMSRLPGRSIKGFGWPIMRYQLWLSTEHLVHRNIHLFGEKVRRYNFDDIQAIVSGPTGRWRTVNIVTSSLLVLLAALEVYLAVSDAPLALIAMPLIAMGIIVGILTGNLYLGPTCKTILYTATSEAPLFSLGRRRTATRSIELILPFVEAAQGASSTKPPAHVETESVPTPSTMPMDEDVPSAGESERETLPEQ